MTKLTFCLLMLSALLPSILFAQPEEMIGTIQGSELSSPFVNQEVILLDAVITFSENGFYIVQSGAGTEDGNALSSDAIMVEGSTNLAIGTTAKIKGLVIEEFGRTMLTDAVVEEIYADPLPKPAPTNLDDFFEGQDQWKKIEIEPLEYMLVEVENGRVGEPSEFDGDLWIYATDKRPQREPGLVGNDSGVPIFDNNLESLETFPLQGNFDNEIPVGSSLIGVGFIGEAWGRYYLALEDYDFQPNNPVRNVPPISADEFSLATANLLFFDSADNDFDIRLEKIVDYFINGLSSPDIIAVQEVRNLITLEKLATALNQEQQNKVYSAYLEQGNNGATINNGYLVSQRIFVDRIAQLGDNQSFSQGGSLHDRPPLLLEGTLNTTPAIPIKVLNLHMRSLSGITGSNGDFVRQKRAEQAASVAAIIENIWADNLFVLGDWNAYQFSDGYVDVFRQIAGGTSEGALIPIVNQAAFTLNNPAANLPAEEQYSFVFSGNTQQIDHLVHSNLNKLTLTDVAFYRGNADAPEAWGIQVNTPGRNSDHDGLVGSFSIDGIWEGDSIAVIPDRPNVLFSNPFTPTDRVHFFPATNDIFTFKIYDSIGRLIRTFTSDFIKDTESWELEIGEFDFSGVYIFVIEGREYFWSKPVFFQH